MAILFWVLGISVVVVLLFAVSFLVPFHWYIAALLAKFDFIFTSVPEGYFKEVVRFGGHRKTLLSKKGYKIDESGNIIRLEEGEAPETSLPGGLRVIGWPFIDTIYKGEMKFLKSLSTGDIKTYNVANVNKFYARVDYPYALPFVRCEDKNNLPLLGHATLLARVKNPVKSLFATANFYDTMIGLILPIVRKRLEKFTFDEIKEKEDLDQLMWKELNEVQPAGLIGTEDDVNVLKELCSRYGIEIVALRIVNVDPPEEYRGITLTKWKAEREADAAGAVAKAEAEKAAGPIGLAMDKWVKSEQEWVEGEEKPKETLHATKERLRKSGEYEKHKKLLADQINRSRKTVQERKIDISSGGEPLEGGSIASIAGSIAAAIIGATAGKKITDKDTSDSGGSTSEKKGDKDKRKKTEDMSPDELEEELDRDD
ncbi:MAG: SPFH domain-containing protein [bacterium]|nr:SPFH domain-containing protein [bacterium]